MHDRLRDRTLTPGRRVRPWHYALHLMLLATMLLFVAPAAQADDRPGLASAFSAEAAYAHVRQLADTIGSRPTGSASEAAAARYLADTLASFGYQTTLQPFSVQVYDERSASITPLQPAGAPIDTAALLYSESGKVSGELVDAGMGRPGDWVPGTLTGRIALLERGEIPFADKVSNVAAEGAVAAVVFNNEPGRFSGSLRRRSSIPALALDQAQGHALRERLATLGLLRVEVLVDAQVATRESRNVVATRPGRLPGAVVVGGHYDSVPAGPGANDNASGTATMVEIARVLSTVDYPYTLYFVAFGAEEIGLRGSQHFVQELSDAARGELRAMINLDMVGVGEQWRVAGDATLVDHARDAVAALELSARFSTTAGASSDHESFVRAGVPSLFVHRTEDPNYHSPRDRAEFIDPQYLGMAGGIALGVLERLAAAEQ